MTQKERICNNALLLIGSAGLSSFDDNSAGSQISKNLFELTYESLLTDTRWHFATRTAHLTKLAPPHHTNIKINETFSEYQIPQDNLYVIKCSVNPYDIYERKIRIPGIQSDEITIDYVFKPELQDTPPYFQQVLEYKLAAKFAIPITEDPQKTQMYTQLAQLELRKAKYLDATSRTVDMIQQDAYISVRY